MGKEINAEGHIINPIRADWAPSSVFITPPAWSHSHHNKSDQDAGLHTYARTLDIQFVR